MIRIMIGEMKKIILFLGFLSLLFACTSELDNQPGIADEQAPVLYASINDEAETRVYLDEDYKVLWHADDRISVFNKNTYNQQYRFDGSTGANAGTFSIVEDGKLKTSNDIDNHHAVYPYRESTSISNSSVLTVNFPAVQTYAPTSFGQGANTMIAVSDCDNLMFKNACGYLMLKLFGDNIAVKSVSLRGNSHEKMAGEATVSMALGGLPSVTMFDSATEEIVLTCDNAVTIGNSAESYTEFWFAIPPVTFTEGFTVTVTDEAGKTFSKSTSSSIEIVRSYAKKMAPLEVSMVTSIPNYLCFTAVEDGTIGLTNKGTSTPNVEYSFDGISWVTWDYSAIAVSAGKKVYFRGNNSTGFSPDERNYSKFTMTGKFAGSGNIQSLLYIDFENNLTIPGDYCFTRLFEYCESLSTAPELPATSLAHGCYYGMFWGCTALTTAPELPAPILENWCYGTMFWGCKSLVSSPVLPAMTLADYCYSNMFVDCANLTYVPDLPAEVMAEGCYNFMFQNCTALETAPRIAASTLADFCFSYMFMGCTSLAAAPELPVLSLVSRCYYQMFNGCSNLNYVKALFTSNPTTDNATYDWLRGVSKTGTFVKNENATWPDSAAIPSGWTVQTAAN